MKRKSLSISLGAVLIFNCANGQLVRAFFDQARQLNRKQPRSPRKKPSPKVRSKTRRPVGSSRLLRPTPVPLRNRRVSAWRPRRRRAWLTGTRKSSPRQKCSSTMTCPAATSSDPGLTPFGSESRYVVKTIKGSSWRAQ